MSLLTSLRTRSGFDSWDASRKLIATCGAGMLLVVLWSAFASVDEITRGMGKVVPSSKVQLIQAAEPATVSAILVRSGQLVKKGDLLVRLDDSQSSSALGQLEAENERLSARADRLSQEGGSGAGGGGCAPGSICAEEAQLAAVRRATSRSKQTGLSAAIEQRLPAERGQTKAQDRVADGAGEHRW